METARTRKVKFTDELVETCVLVMLAGVGESGIGVSGLFTDKKLGRAAPDFEQYVDLKYFQLFQKAIPFVFTDEALWEKAQDRGNVAWSDWMPMLPRVQAPAYPRR